MENSRLIGEAMQHPGLVLLVIVGSTLIASALYNSLVTVRGLFRKSCFRDGLKKEITDSRLGRMLSRMGVDLQYYIFSTASSDIEKHMRTCNHCDNSVK